MSNKEILLELGLKHIKSLCIKRGYKPIMDIDSIGVDLEELYELIKWNKWLEINDILRKR